MAANSADVIVVGGGLHGLSVALYLSLEEVRVLVLEKDYPGRHASGVNAGGVRRLIRDPAEVPLSVAAMKLWHDIEALVDDDCGFTRCGQLMVAETEDELARLGTRAARIREMGYDHEELIDSKELFRLVPDIAPHCLGGLVSRDDGAALPFRAVDAFRRRVLTLGARIVTGTAVTGIERSNGIWQVSAGHDRFEAPALVNAAGAWGHRVAAMLGDTIPLEAHAPMLMITEPVQPFLTPVLAAAGRRLSFKQLDNGTLLIGGGFKGVADTRFNRADTRLAGLTESARTVQALFPQLKDIRIVRSWAGLEGVLPDNLPVLGPSEQTDAAFHSFGYSYHGFQLSPITGRIIAELICGSGTDFPIEPFRPNRFA